MRTTTTIRTLLTTFSLALATMAMAQTSVDDIIAKVEAQQKTVKDYRARVVGTVEAQSDQKLKLDLEVLAIPSLDLLRVNFTAPDSLADNFFIVDKDTVSNYLYLTNQVTVSKLNKQNVAGFNFDFSQFTNFSDGLPKNKLNYKPVTTETTPAGKAFVLEATPKPNSDLEFGRIKTWVLEKEWRPYRVQYFNDKGAQVADITISEYKANIGLKASDLKKIPKDAEVKTSKK